ncbi:hypothetical protein DFJ74DRAFT_766474 [Hyaloraphidium curvatum]|nr:hypothetical protein DFJ74DRAFT_766474 [Hyaloraphidium curvatum]
MRALHPLSPRPAGPRARSPASSSEGGSPPARAAPSTRTAPAGQSESSAEVKKAAGGVKNGRGNFLAVEIRRLKSLHPTMKHKSVFKMAAGNWATAEENPRRKDA